MVDHQISFAGMISFNDSKKNTDENNSKHKFYYKNSKRQIVPSEEEDINKKAMDRLSHIRATCNNIPNLFIDNWHKVKLYNPKGNIESATAIMLDINEGAYDIKNPLNDMTGKEWTKFSCSWFIFNALQSDLKEEREVTKETQSHPATFSPTMIADFIKFFTKEGQKVIDPFAGIGSTLVGCKRTGRIGYGIEINKKYYNIINLRVPEFKNNIFNWDATKLNELDLPMFDYSISSPPYWDVLNRSTDGFKKDRTSKGLDVNYSDSEVDLGNVKDYDKFLELTCGVYEKLHSYMKIGAYITIIVKNVKKQGKLYPLAWDIGKKLNDKYELKDEKIWIQDKIGLSPYGYPHSWASNILHHYCLILRKE